MGRQSGPVEITDILKDQSGHRALMNLDRSTQYFTPLTGATIVLTRSNFVDCLINPAGTIAALTITVPASPQNDDEICFSTSQIITTLTITGLITGTLAANGFLRFKYNSTKAGWFRIG